MPPRFQHSCLCLRAFFSLETTLLGKWEWQRPPSREQLSTVTDGSWSINSPQPLSVVVTLTVEFFSGSLCSSVRLSTGCLFCCWWPPLSHFPTLLSVFTSISSEISYLHLNPHLRFCFWQNSTWDTGRVSGWLCLHETGTRENQGFRPSTISNQYRESWWAVPLAAGRGKCSMRFGRDMPFSVNTALPRGPNVCSVSLPLFFSCFPDDWCYKLEQDTSRGAWGLISEGLFSIVSITSEGMYNLNCWWLFLKCGLLTAS